MNEGEILIQETVIWIVEHRAPSKHDIYIYIYISMSLEYITHCTRGVAAQPRTGDATHTH